MRRDIFQAIADPIRRDIIQQIAEGPLTVSTIAERFDVSRPAISKHIKILRECGVIDIERKGREHFCFIKPKELVPAFLWIDQYKSLWEQKIDSFEEYVIHLKNKSHSNEKQ